MTTSHTPGRLRYEYEPGYCGELIASNGHVVCHFDTEPSKEDARRLVACWNACDGLPTSDLENSALPEIMTNLMEANVQRDELLEAAKAALQVFVNQGWDDDLVAAKSLSAAIQKAEGKA